MNQTRYFRFTLSPLSLRTHSTSSICDHGVPPRDLGTIAREDPRRTYQEDGELWSNGDRRPADAAASARRPGQAFVPSVWIIDPPPRAQCYPRWSQGRALWQRDALRRLTQAEALTDRATADLTAICNDRTLPAQPLTADHIRGPYAGMPAVQLRALRDFLNINALLEEQRLTFLNRMQLCKTVLPSLATANRPRKNKERELFSSSGDNRQWCGRARWSASTLQAEPDLLAEAWPPTAHTFEGPHRPRHHRLRMRHFDGPA